MRSYLVTWEMEFDAESPQAAAKLAREAQRDPESLATVFNVIGPTGKLTHVDLAEEED